MQAPADSAPIVVRGVVVLCGGRGTRMGEDKAWLPFRGEPLLARVVRRLAPSFGDVVVVARPGQPLPAIAAPCRVVLDDVPDRGPLGGLAPGLRASRADAVFVTGCDTPFVSADVAALLFDRLGGADGVVVTDDGRACPLCAVYRTSLASDVAERVATGRLRASELAARPGIVRVPSDELRATDPHLRCLVNVNTPESLAAALALPE
jgi:molybdopterin-guanine dinucleotide biosynthesis protein A